MATKFTGFPPQALSFFRQLARNNRRDWFQPRKGLYDEHVRGPMLELVELINDDLRGFAADHVTEPARAVYRIYRDTRFSKDKTPYKTHVAAIFPRPGLPRHAGAGFYFSISHTGVEVAGGMYMPGPQELAAVRQVLARDEKAFRRLTASPALRRLMGELQGTSLARVPRGHDPDDPAADLLRRKQLYFGKELPSDVALSPSLRREVSARFKAMAPVVHYLNAVVLQAMRSEEGDAEVPVRPAPMF
jgi:uncharacterized protein (TIGR02453 family)